MVPRTYLCLVMERPLHLSSTHGEAALSLDGCHVPVAARTVMVVAS